MSMNAITQKKHIIHSTVHISNIKMSCHFPIYISAHGAAGGGLLRAQCVPPGGRGHTSGQRPPACAQVFVQGGGFNN